MNAAPLMQRILSPSQTSRMANRPTGVRSSMQPIFIGFMPEICVALSQVCLSFAMDQSGDIATTIVAWIASNYPSKMSKL